jgi:hypothetical protein
MRSSVQNTVDLAAPTARRGPGRRAFGTALGAVAAAVLIGSTAVVPASAATTADGSASVSTRAAVASLSLPGGRPNYVVSTLTGRYNHLVVKLAQYTFSTDGTLSQRYWTWKQDSVTGDGNAKYTKVASGYTTQGCRFACPIRTPVGFQHGGNGRLTTGQWTRRLDGTVAVSFPGASTEVWQVRTSAALASLVLSHSSGNRGWALGSTAPLSLARDMTAFYNTTRIYGPAAENVYGARTFYTHLGFHNIDFTRCSNGTCLQAKGYASGDKRSWFHSYLATNPAADGRKMFWNLQTGAVSQMENPGTVCISVKGGGHTDALLQAIDDNGRLVGVVGVEASINQLKHGQAIVGSFAMLPPSLSTLVEG